MEDLKAENERLRAMLRDADERGPKIVTRFTPEEMLREIERLIEPLKAPAGTPPELTVKLVDALWPPTPDTPSDAPAETPKGGE